MLTISVTSDSDFTPFEEYIISPFHYMHYRMCQSWGYVCRLMTLFVCMDLSDVLSRTYFTNEIWEGSIFINMIKVGVAS